MPAIWPLEVANALVVAERRKKILAAKSTQFLHDLQQLSITIDTDGLDRVFDDVVELARINLRTSYDASYLELARRRNLPLATKDAPLRKAAEDLGVAIYNPDQSASSH